MSSVLKIPYDSALHTRIRDAILARYRLSERKMGDKWEAWRKSEELHLAYIPETEANASRRSLRESGKPQQTTFVIPYSYAILMTAHMYWSTVFLSRNPVMQFSARHGEVADQEQKIEALMDYQVQIGQHMVPLYVWLMDAGKYGLGIVCSYWDEEEVTVSEISEELETYLGIPIPGTKKKVRRTKTFPGYVGNRLFNVRPYDFICDPRVPVMEFQRGEFAGRQTETGWNDIQRKNFAGQYFNIDTLKRRRAGLRDVQPGASSMIMPDPSELADISAQTESMNDVGFIPTIEMYIELVPNDWGLGSSQRPEKWYFVLADKTVVICARPAGSFHNKYPYYVQEYEIDGYQLAKRSMMDILKPLNDTITWLVDTHHSNIRKVINDQFVIDPSRLVMADVLNPAGGRMWRLRPEAYGSDPRLAVHQLQVVDVTQNNLRDSQFVVDLMQRVSGVSDNMMGFVNAGGRKTATEVRSSNTLGVNRLKVTAEYNSALGWSPYAQTTLQETQQRYDLERKYKIAGVSGNNPGFERAVMVTPEDIKGFYDFVPIDGTMPIDRFAMASMNKELMVDTMKIPQIAQQTDYMRWLGYIAELQGMRNFDRFTHPPQIQVVPDGQIATEAQAGNIVPLGGMGGKSGRGAPGAQRVSGVAGPASMVPLG